MPPELALYITKYGYLAIFSLVFLQEIGIPNPVPNELVILFSGYLASIHTLSFPLVFLMVVAGDFIGTSLLFFVFYYFGDFFLAHKPRWLPLSREKIDKLGDRISRNGGWGIFIGRLLPYVRGYASVAAGLLHIRPRVFLTSVILSAMVWSGGYALAGRLFGNYFESIIAHLGNVRILMLSVLGLLFIFLAWRYFHKRKKHRVNNQEGTQ